MTNSWFSEIPKAQPKNKENKKNNLCSPALFTEFGSIIIDKHKNKCYNA